MGAGGRRSRGAPRRCERATAEDLIEHASKSIARYKLPKAVVFRDEVQRSPSGKADCRWAKEQVDADQAPSR